MTVLVVSGGIALGGLAVVTELPASAALSLVSCSAGHGTSSASPGYSTTPANQTLVSAGSVTSCSGQEVGTASVGANLTTAKPGTCKSVTSNPSPSGTKTANGVFRIQWPDATTSTGTASLVSTGKVLPIAFAGKITGGSHASFVGHKVKGKINFAPTSACPFTSFTYSDSGAFTVV